MERVDFADVVWVVNAVMLVRGKRGRRLHLGYCTEGRGVAFVAMDMLHVVVIRNVDIREKPSGEKTCGDAEWCFNLKCPLNRARPEKMRSYGAETREDLERMHRWLETVLSRLVEMYGEELVKGKHNIVSFREAPLTVEIKDRS